MSTSVGQLEDVQMHIDQSHTSDNAIVSQLSSFLHHETVAPESMKSTPDSKFSVNNLYTPVVTPDQLAEQAGARKRQQDARKDRWITRNRGSGPQNPSTIAQANMARGGIEKKTPKKWKSRATDSKLSLELDRLLVGDDASAASTRQPHAVYRVQHPLRSVLHSLPGFTYDTELDSVVFRKHKRVLFGIEGLVEEGGRNAAKLWLEGFLLLTFDTMGKVLERYPTCKELDGVPMGFVTMARDVETAVNQLSYEPALRARRAMEKRLCQSHDLRKLVEWTMAARRRFLGSKPKIMPGFGVFGQATFEKGTDLEEQLWAIVDARIKASTNVNYD